MINIKYSPFDIHPKIQNLKYRPLIKNPQIKMVKYRTDGPSITKKIDVIHNPFVDNSNHAKVKDKIAQLLAQFEDLQQHQPQVELDQQSIVSRTLYPPSSIITRVSKRKKHDSGSDFYSSSDSSDLSNSSDSSGSSSN